MRTTLDIDDAVLSAARAKARAENVSLGRAVSDLARRGLGIAVEVGSDALHGNGDEAAPGRIPGFPVLRGAPGHVVTDELVAAYVDDAP
ncbi:hypothetical protein [Salana multivorans]